MPSFFLPSPLIPLTQVGEGEYDIESASARDRAGVFQTMA